MRSLADAILQENVDDVRGLLRYGDDVNQLDEYGFTPLIEAAIVENIEITKLLLGQGANPNLQDATGGTPLQWAAENNNLALCRLLLANGANPNAYNFSGQPVLAMPTLRRQSALRQLLVKAGADQLFTEDYINTKLLGHMFELVGTASIVDPQNQFVEVDFEGFFLEITVGLIANSLAQFQNHFAARKLRRYSGVANFIVDVLERASQLIKYQQYRVNLGKYQHRIDALIRQQPLLIPIGYEGHAITFISYDNLWVKCDRREDSRLYDNIMFYVVENKKQLNMPFFRRLFYEKKSDEFVNEELDQLLDLKPVTELKVEAQISGNCSWANVEAVIPAIFFLVLMKLNSDQDATSYFKTLSLNYFHRWREWNKERALQLCIRSFERGDQIRKACKAEILAAILFQRCNPENAVDRQYIESIVAILLNSPFEYILRNYLRIYYYENPTEEGKRFFHLLKNYGFKG